jgi:hypothetical protein
MTVKKRPYMIVHHTRTPVPGSNTAEKNWMQKGEMNVNEQVSFDLQIKSKVMISATFIIDLLSKKLVRNRVGDTVPEKDLVDFYIDKYKEQVSKVVMQYMMLHGRVPDVVEDDIKINGIELEPSEQSPDISATVVAAE